MEGPLYWLQKQLDNDIHFLNQNITLLKKKQLDQCMMVCWFKLLDRPVAYDLVKVDWSTQQYMAGQTSMTVFNVSLIGWSPA